MLLGQSPPFKANRKRFVTVDGDHINQISGKPGLYSLYMKLIYWVLTIV